MPKVASLGDINVDVAVNVPTLPGPGEETFADRSHLGLGGSAANTAVVLTRLGVEAMVLAQVGRDSFGEFATTLLAATGIDTSRVDVSPSETTGLNLIVVTPDGERTMVGARGANAGFRGEAGGGEEIDWLHVSGYAFLAEPQRSTARAAIKAAASRATPVSIDIPSGVAMELGSDLLGDLAGMRIVSIGERGLGAVAGDVSPAERLLSLRVGVVAVTAGDERCRLVDDTGQASLVPPQVPSVDTTGAGDAFVAGLVAADLAGLDRGATLVVASTLGAAATTHRGAGVGLGAPGTVATALREGEWADVDPRWIERAERWFDFERSD